MAPASKTDESTIFFYREDDKDVGFMSNFYCQPFTAPDPASWLFELANPTPAPPTSSNPTIGTGREQEPATIEFRHSEQYFIYCKALCMGDHDTAWMILQAKSPAACKALGKAVRGFSEEKWEKDDINVRVMEEALWWKFGGGQLSHRLLTPEKKKEKKPKAAAAKDQRLEAIGDLGRRLLATGERQLVEAAKRDSIWGIGYSVKELPNIDKKNWGRNQLGKSLMAVRQRLKVLVDDGPKI